jgi:hypothetical protein
MSIGRTFKEALQKGVSTNAMDDILRKWYSHYKPISLKVLRQLYINYARGKYSNIVNIPRRRKHHRKVVGAVYYDKSYKTFVKQSSIDKVKLAVNKFELNYNPTSEVLLKETKLSKNQLFATLSYMRKKGDIIVVHDDVRGTIYQPVIRQDGM